VPVGVPETPGGGLTVAVNVTVCPYTEGFRLEARVVVVGAVLTSCETWKLWLTDMAAE
jgi:hypothetical protein